jgi:hypothetical protein
LRRRPRLDEQVLKIGDHRRVALRQFRRDPVPWREKVFDGLSAGRVLRLVRILGRTAEEPAARLGGQAVVLLVGLEV